MYRATGPGNVQVIAEDKTAGIVDALLYNFDHDDFAGGKMRALKKEHATFLMSHVLPLVEKSRGSVWLQGSASQIGSDGWNMTTSMVRAGQVQAFLLNSGVKPDQIEANAIGETQAAIHAKDDPRDRGVYLWVRPQAKAATKIVPPKPKAAPTKVEKLYIYDQSSGIDRTQASGRFTPDEVLQIGINGGITELKSAFDKLLTEKRAFNRVLFQTHGSSGAIWFGSEMLDKNVLQSKFSLYTDLFPNSARIYFDGCNVAEGGAGTDFLLKAGSVFLVKGGGEVVGWVTLGYGMPGVLPFIGGHTLHFGGGENLKRIRFFPGGQPNFTDSWIPGR